MKKIMFLGGLLLSAMTFVGCSDDFTDWASPQTNPQEDAIELPGYTASAVTTSIDLSTVTGDSVQVLTLSDATLPEGAVVSNTRVELLPDGDETATAVTLAVDNEGRVGKADLQATIEGFYGKRPEARTLVGHVYSNVMINGQAFLVDAQTINVVATPEAPYIASAYYLVGDMCGWDAASAIKFTHSDADVYDDPVFSVVFTTPKADCYWKIVPQGNIDSGDLWHEGTDGVVGVAVDGDPSLAGSLVTTAPKAGKIEKQGFYKLTVNMMDYTYTIEEMAGEYYMVGDLQGWNNDPATGMTCLFYPQTNTVMSYTTKWKGAYDLKFWAGADFGNWDKAYGCAVDGDNSPAGNIVNSNAQSISAPSAEFYTFTIDMTTMKYTWTKLDNQAPKEYTSISLIGDFNAWNGDVDLTQVTPHNWYAKVSIPSDGGLKFRADHAWTDSWGNGANIAENYYGKADYNGDNMTVPAGTYSVYFNDITTEFVFLAE